MTSFNEFGRAPALARKHFTRMLGGLPRSNSVLNTSTVDKSSIGFPKGSGFCSAPGFFPYRDMLVARAGEQLARPPRPAIAQPQPGELGHEVEFRRPHVSKRYRSILAAA